MGATIVWGALSYVIYTSVAWGPPQGLIGQPPYVAYQLQPDVIQHSNMPHDIIGQFSFNTYVLVTWPYKTKQMELQNQIPPKVAKINVFQ